MGEGFSQLRTGIYSGTAILNRLLERKGRCVGVLVSGGMEDYHGIMSSMLHFGIKTTLPGGDRFG